ncbi:SPOR domain-containing protein [Solemya pervernicosa gill symbiont]|uniref:SPOR domain-containing protein n=1 Tax=Solemya pervernicosa gill symbiont TaxID=642797 RepID=UPI0010835F23|nr:SPOR domain-containing protein [Solemya pervernicosa gill symbiont]
MSERRRSGEVVSVASSDAGEYWVQVSASSKGYLAPAYLKNYPNLLQHRHRDRQGLHRLLIGPYRSFDKAQSLRMAMNRDHGAGTFVRFAASERGMSRVVVEAPAEHPRATPANQSMENHVEHADLAVTDEIRVEQSSDETSVTADRDESQDALVATGLDRGVSADIGRGTPLKIGVSLGAAYAADQRLRFYGEDEPDPLSNLFPAWNNGTLARTESNLLSRHFGVHLQKLFNSEWGIAVDYLHERSEMDQQPMRPELLDINHTTTLRYLDGSLASYNAGSTDHLSGLLVRNHLDGVVLFPINNTFTAKMGLSAAHHDLSADLTQLKLDQTLLQSVSHDINTLFIGIMGGWISTIICRIRSLSESIQSSTSIHSTQSYQADRVSILQVGLLTMLPIVNSVTTAIEPRLSPILSTPLANI